MQEALIETIYVVVGLISMVSSFYILKQKDAKDGKKRYTSAIFYFLFGLLFMTGNKIPPDVSGGIILLMGVLAIFNGVGTFSYVDSKPEDREKHSHRVGNLLFIPALLVGLVAFAVAQWVPSLGGLVGLGIGSVVAWVVAMFVTNSGPGASIRDGSSLLSMMGSAAVLPIFLAALGDLFSKAGVGNAVSNAVSSVIVSGSRFWGVVFYVVGMALFTVIMGNAFAAFAVITVGIGVPFVYSQGADPSITGILALTAGYCGTLITPMAANFNVVPTLVLDMKGKYRVIRAQFPFALLMLATHVVLIDYMAF